MITRFYREIADDREDCIAIESREQLTEDQKKLIRSVFSEHSKPEKFGEESFLPANGAQVCEIGPRISLSTSKSTNAKSACAIPGVTRIEKLRRYIIPQGVTVGEFAKGRMDKMTEQVYPENFTSFESPKREDELVMVPVLEEGITAVEAVNKRFSLGMAPDICEHVVKVCRERLHRDMNSHEVTMVAVFTADHSRHTTWTKKEIADSVEQEETLMQIAKSTLWNAPNTVIAFHDNSSALRGGETTVLFPEDSGKPGPFKFVARIYHPTSTAETHNYPCQWEPYQGAVTCIDGLERDAIATGKGSIIGAVHAVYVTGAYGLPGYEIPGEPKDFVYEDTYAKPLWIYTRATEGMADSGNEFGVPNVGVRRRTAAYRLPNGERIESLKPTVFGAHTGFIDDEHAMKSKLEKGMLLVRFGGPAMPVGIGGGIGSSVIQGTLSQDVDLAAVQRGDGEMQNKQYKVILTNIMRQSENLIELIHDQGAGGLTNVLSELMGELGGTIDLRQVTLADTSMNNRELLTSEFQESCGIAIWPKNLAAFQAICERERVPCDVVGEITGDGRIVVIGLEGNVIVDLPIREVLEGVPQKVVEITTIERKLNPFVPPLDLSFAKACERVFVQASVASTADVVHMKDRSVGGKVVYGQCSGPLQAPISDMMIIATSAFADNGVVSSLGEHPGRILVDPAAGARMCLGEAICNILGAVTGVLELLKVRVNWIWPANLPGEGVRVRKAAKALRDLMKELRIEQSGGKDSSSAAAKVLGELVKAIGQIIVKLDGYMPDVSLFVPAHIRKPGRSKLALIDMTGKCRLGGSALAYSFGETGNESPDVDDANVLVSVYNAMQKLVAEGKITAYLGRVRDGGLMATLAKMAIAGNCGMNIEHNGGNALAAFFAEELGGVIEYEPECEAEIMRVFALHLVRECLVPIGETTEQKVVTVRFNGSLELSEETKTLRRWFERTTVELEKLRMRNRGGDVSVVDEEQELNQLMLTPQYRVTFEPKPTPEEILDDEHAPSVLIIREEGSNGEEDMRTAWKLAGFNVIEACMEDLLSEKAPFASFDQFRVLATVGGFSYADVPESARGWAASIRFNPRVEKMFRDFFDRDNTYSYHVCNGDQMILQLGVLPFRDLPDHEAPRLVHNRSRKFESRFLMVRIEESNSVFFRGMAGSVLGVHCAHGEGQYHFPNPELLQRVLWERLAPVRYAQPNGEVATKYPWNPNGSPHGIAGLISPCGRHLGMMPHAERGVLLRQWGWVPDQLAEQWQASPLLRMFQNVREECAQVS